MLPSVNWRYEYLRLRVAVRITLEDVIQNPGQCLAHRSHSIHESYYYYYYYTIIITTIILLL